MNWTTIIVTALICGTVLALYLIGRKDGKQ